MELTVCARWKSHRQHKRPQSALNGQAEGLANWHTFDLNACVRAQCAGMSCDSRDLSFLWSKCEPSKTSRTDPAGNATVSPPPFSSNPPMTLLLPDGGLFLPLIHPRPLVTRTLRVKRKEPSPDCWPSKPLSETSLCWVTPWSRDAHRKHTMITASLQRIFFFLMHLWILMKNQLQTVSVRITNLCQSSREAKKEDEKTAWAEEGKHVVAWIATPNEKTGGNYAICQVTVASVRVFCFLWLFQPFKALNYKPAFYFYVPIILMQHCNILHALYSADWEIPLQM